MIRYVLKSRDIQDKKNIIRKMTWGELERRKNKKFYEKDKKKGFY